VVLVRVRARRASFDCAFVVGALAQLGWRATERPPQSNVQTPPATLIGRPDGADLDTLHRR